MLLKEFIRLKVNTQTLAKNVRPAKLNTKFLGHKNFKHDLAEHK